MPERADFYWAETEPMTYGDFPGTCADNAAFQEQYYPGLLTPQTNTSSLVLQKEEDPFGDDNFMNPFSVTYASMTGIDTSGSQNYMDFDPHVNATGFFDPYPFHSSTFP